MKALESTVTQKGQVTIPAAVRARLGLRPKDKVRFEVAGDAVTLQPAPSKLLAGYGAVRPRKRPEKWTQVRSEVERLMAEDVVAEDA